MAGSGVFYFPTLALFLDTFFEVPYNMQLLPWGEGVPPTLGMEAVDSTPTGVSKEGCPPPHSFTPPRQPTHPRRPAPWPHPHPSSASWSFAAIPQRSCVRVSVILCYVKCSFIFFPNPLRFITVFIVIIHHEFIHIIFSPCYTTCFLTQPVALSPGFCGSFIFVSCFTKQYSVLSDPNHNIDTVGTII